MSNDQCQRRVFDGPWQLSIVKISVNKFAYCSWHFLESCQKYHPHVDRFSLNKNVQCIHITMSQSVWRRQADKSRQQHGWFEFEAPAFCSSPIHREQPCRYIYSHFERAALQMYLFSLWAAETNSVLTGYWSTCLYAHHLFTREHFAKCTHLYNNVVLYQACFLQ